MKREKENELKAYLKHKKEHSNVLIVSGARQIGKTFMVENHLQGYPNVISLNLERDLEIKMAIDEAPDFDEFTKILEVKKGFKTGKHFIVFIDEAQESENLGRFVREMKESWVHTKTILTGSSMHRLFPEKQRIPVGRVEFLTLYPFSFREFSRAQEREDLLDMANNEIRKKGVVTNILHQELLKIYDDYMKVGGLPEVVFAYKEKRAWESLLNAVYSTQREDFLRKDKMKQHLFSEAMRGVSNHVGGISKFTHITDNKYDAQKILAHLTDWHLIHEVLVAGGQTTQTISEKRYLYDLGMLRLNRTAPVPELSLLTTLSDALRIPLGGIAENAVLLTSLNSKTPLQISSWRKAIKEPIEVDFILKTVSKLLPVEVKASLRVTNRHAKNIKAYSEINHVNHGIVVSFDNYKEIISDSKLTVENIPIYLFEDYLEDFFIR